MLSLTARLLITIVLFIFCFFLFRTVIKKRLELSYILSWLVLCVGLLIILWFPMLIDNFAHLVGVYEPTNLIFFIGFCLSLAITFSLTSKLSSQSVQIKKLTQHLALLEKKNDDERKIEKK